MFRLGSSPGAHSRLVFPKSAVWTAEAVQEHAALSDAAVILAVGSRGGRSRLGALIEMMKSVGG